MARNAPGIPVTGFSLELKGGYPYPCSATMRTVSLTLKGAPQWSNVQAAQLQYYLQSVLKT